MVEAKVEISEKLNSALIEEIESQTITYEEKQMKLTIE
jgi:hypothetical protein